MTIQRRDVDFGFTASAVPRDWVSGDAFQTAFLNALSAIFPEGEKFFVESVKRFRRRVPHLQQEVAGFIGQEAMHGKEHRAFNELLEAHGYPSTPEIDRKLRALLDRVRKRVPARGQLAVTCAVEHFTAMLAEALLENPRMRSELHENVRPFWLWHALEEAEHKAVAFDVFAAVGGTYAERIIVMMIVTLGFIVVQTMGTGHMLADRKILYKPWRWIRGATRFWVWPGYFTRLLPAYLDYFRRDFHPNDRDSSATVEKWRNELFGDAGTLREKTRLIA
jgi:predicted metal-dependent hydrolase